MDINKKLRYDLYTKEPEAVKLLIGILKEYKEFCEKNNCKPVFLLMPQKDDVLLIKKQKKSYYEPALKEIEKMMVTIDVTNLLLNRADLDDLYADDNQYGGHFSKKGSKVVAKYIFEEMTKQKAI